MKIEWLVTDVSAVRSPDRAECAILAVILTERNMLFWGRFWLRNLLANSGRFRGRGATLCCRNPLLSPNNFTYVHLTIVQGLVTDFTSVQSPDRAESAVLGVILAGSVFCQFRTYLWSLSHFVI